MAQRLRERERFVPGNRTNRVTRKSARILDREALPVLCSIRGNYREK
jgi:hypothetical protein